MQREEVFDLLAKNYVEDDDNVFRFRYSPDFLTWYVPANVAPLIRDLAVLTVRTRATDASSGHSRRRATSQSGWLVCARAATSGFGLSSQASRLTRTSTISTSHARLVTRRRGCGFAC